MSPCKASIAQPNFYKTACWHRGGTAADRPL